MKQFTHYMKSPFAIPVAVTAGILSGLLDISYLNIFAKTIADIFMRVLKLLSLPVISFALLSTLSGLGNWQTLQRIGLRIVRYTLFTTIVSASFAAALFAIFRPKLQNMAQVPDNTLIAASGSYTEQLLNSFIPSNIMQPFVEHNVIGVLMIAIFFGLGILSLPEKKRIAAHEFLDSIFSVVMNLIKSVALVMPIAVFAFITQFVHDMQAGLDLSKLAIYLGIVVGANLIQAIIFLPLLLRAKGIPVVRSVKGMSEALSLAFFSKSSAATMPVAMTCAENLKADPQVVRFSFPLCTTINMNACAGFIYITVLFVASSHGVQFDVFEQIMWIFIATIAAIGNAGVPMGCFFLSSALLTTMGVPLTLMGVILPVYAVIDMIESAINIWSDSCVTLIVDKDLKTVDALQKV